MKLRSIIKDNKAMAGMTGASQMMMLYLSIFIGSVFGLALTPSFYEFCQTAQETFAGENYSAIFTILFELGLPALWVMCCVAGLGATIFAFYRIAKRL